MKATNRMSDGNFLVPQIKPEQMLTKKLPCPFSPAGMLQPSHLQPPPMFGPRGSTIPPKHLAPYAHFKINRSQPRSPAPNKNFNHQYRPKDSVSRYNKKFDNSNHTRPPQRYQQSREFWCEPCDRDFRSQDLLLEHKKQHQKCGIDGCKFEGHELIVSKHIQMQHSTGLYERLKNLETPEDILKWREERKKRYPTKANIELRQQMQEERNKRGEKLTNSTGRFGRNSDRKRCNNSRTTEGNHVTDKNAEKKQDKNREGKKKRRRPNKKIITTVEHKVDECDEKESLSNNGLPMFRGTSQLKNYKKRKEMQPKNALSNLLGMYESDSDSGESFSDGTSSSEEMETDVTTLISSQSSDIDSKSRVDGIVLNVSEQASVAEDDSKDLHDEEPIEKCDFTILENSSEEVLAINDMDESPNEERIQKMEDVADSLPSGDTLKIVKNRKTKTNSLDKRLSKRPTILDLSKKYRNQNTMLEKLLQNDIRHERNVLLQCVRHVVKENFFGIGQKSSSS